MVNGAGLAMATMDLIKLAVGTCKLSRRRWNADSIGLKRLSDLYFKIQM
ncbi:MAG: hypothetical protein CM15mP102_07210 [Flavobacteriales bacterium]|nr:MAG: hypothetical protein CM15mP102_07210 [Flavobacteriales bacterium]